MRKVKFGFFDNSGLPVDSRILIFYSFETDDRLARSGILHYHIGEGRFVGPRHDRELTTAAMDFLDRSGRLTKPPCPAPPSPPSPAPPPPATSPATAGGDGRN